MNIHDKVNYLLSLNNGFLTTQQTREFGISSKVLSQLVIENIVEKVAYGLYLGAEYWPDPFYIAQYRYPKLIFSHLTALFLHGLSNRDPLIYMATIPTGGNSRLLKSTDFRFYYNNEKLIAMGVEKIKSPWGNEIKVFDVERTLCDCIKYINHLDRDLILTGFKFYLKSEQKNSIKLMEYAKQLKISDKIYQYLEVL